MKQRIQITGKNIDDLFRLPCVLSIQKGIVMREHNKLIISQNLEDCTIDILRKPFVNTSATWAKMGDWIVEDDNGNWHVEEGDKK